MKNETIIIRVKVKTSFIDIFKLFLLKHTKVSSQQSATVQKTTWGITIVQDRLKFTKVGH